MSSCKYQPTAKHTKHAGVYCCPNAVIAWRDESAPTQRLENDNDGVDCVKPLLYGDLCWYHERIVHPTEVGKELHPKETT